MLRSTPPWTLPARRSRGRFLPRRLGRRVQLFAMLAVLLYGFWGCAPSIDNSRVELPPPVESTSVGPDDVFTLTIVREKDLPEEFHVASDGTVELPYLHRVPVAGLEAHQIAELVRTRLIEAKILVDPSVIVSVKEYRSRKVTVLGQVQKPGSFPLTSGMTLLQAISVSGGFTSIAKSDRVRLTRKGRIGARTVELSVDSITEGNAPDVPLQTGDVIFVAERVF